MGVSREGANGCPWSQLPPLRRVGLQQHQQSCCSGVVGRAGGRHTLTSGDDRDKNSPSLSKHHAFLAVLAKNRNCLMWLMPLTLHVTKVALPVLLESLELASFQLYLEM